jgi:hypothetical protein
MTQMTQISARQEHFFAFSAFICGQQSAWPPSLRSG